MQSRIAEGGHKPEQSPLVLSSAPAPFASPDQHWSVAAQKYLARVTDKKLHRRLTRFLNADDKAGFFAAVLSAPNSVVEDRS